MVLVGASIMGVILLLMGLFLYSIAVADQYISTAYTLSRSVVEVLRESSEVDLNGRNSISMQA